MDGLSGDFWVGRRVLVTGHTGFKGAWLCLWLGGLGARVSALALPPASEPSLFELAAIGHGLDEERIDIRERDRLAGAVGRARPEIVFHLAAQALVRPSYRDPVGTFATNVMGTLHLLAALAEHAPEAVVVAVTSDKVYANDGAGRRFAESDPLGGGDPYSASKAAAELAAAAFRASRPELRMATARAGNVIGGGDWGEERVVPDLVRALVAGSRLRLRHPAAVRPWQHVLDPLHGYLMLAERLARDPASVPAALNFGPDPGPGVTVADLAGSLDAALGGRGWEPDPGPHPHEAATLALDSSLARRALGWRPRLDQAATVAWTAEWYRGWRAGEPAAALCRRQIAAFLALEAAT